MIDNLIETSKEKKTHEELDLGVAATGGDGGSSTRSRASSGGETDDDDYAAHAGKKKNNKIGHFNSHSREKLVVSLLQNSIILQRYDISFEVAKVFLQDLLKINYLPVFEILQD